MKILHSEKYEESKVLLKLGEDFKRSDLQNFLNTSNLCLRAYRLDRIAKNNNFDAWTWQGNFDNDTGCIEALFRREIKIQ